MFKNDSQNTWDAVREIFGNFEGKSEFQSFIEKGEHIKGNLRIAGGFNNFFLSKLESSFLLK